MARLDKWSPEKILEAVAGQIGKTDWYFNLHYYRFIYILDIVLGRKNRARKESLLELGVWPGYLALALQKANFEVWGIDIDSKRILQVSPQLKIIDYDLNAELLKIPFPDNHFDCIVISEIIEHIDPKNLPGLFLEIERLLNKDGYAVITTPNNSSLHNLVTSKNKIANKFNNGHGHVREYSLSELRAIIDKYPLCIIKSKSVNFYSNVGTLSRGKYFYPLKNFWKYPNKLFNLLKIFSTPMKQIPLLRDSLIILVQKND